MDLLTQIKRNIVPEFADYEQFFAQVMQSDNYYLNQVLTYLRAKQGKQIRPLLILMSAKLCGQITETTLRLAASMELLHTASLLHDDVVDTSFERRGQASVNAEWNNKTAVLVGDYMLAKSIELGISVANEKALKIIAKIGQILASGELLQLYVEWKNNPEESTYFEIIRQKTASLFASCMQLGAVSVNASETDVERMGLFGEYLGICFQLKDDYFDFASDKDNVGKPVLNDIKDGKITLPLLKSLKTAPADEATLIMQQLRQKQIDNVEVIKDFVIRYGGLDYTSQKMEEYRLLAEEQLSAYPCSPIRQALSDILLYAIKRTH